jgi:hypothetical protein
MELILLTGLAYAGNYLSNYNESNEDKYELPKHEVLHNDSIYDSDIIGKTSEKVEKKADELNKLSMNPEKTKVIPQFYNQLGNNNKSNIKIIREKDMNNKTYLADNADKITNNDNLLETFNRNKRIKRNLKESYVDQFNPQVFDSNGKPVCSNDIHESTDDSYMLSLERDLALKKGWSIFDEEQDMTYGIVGKNEFRHNNMQPFFTGRGMEFNEYNEQNRAHKVELFSGSSRNYIPKHEVEPFFEPTPNENVLTRGMPNHSDFLQTRYIPGNGRNNQLPFEQKQVGPGLNLDPNEDGHPGMYDTYRNLPKTTNELRSKFNPKETYKGVIIPGQKGQKRPTQAPVVKRRPETFKTSTYDDLQKAGGAYTGPTVRDNFELCPTKKQQANKPYVGVAESQAYKLLPTGRNPLVKESSRNIYESNTPFNPSGNEHRTNRNLNSYQMPPNERSTTDPNSRAQGIGSSNRSVYASQMDQVKETLKETMINDGRGGNIVIPVQAIVSRLMDEPRMTNKQTTIYDGRGGVIKAPVNRIVAQLMDNAKATTKETTIYDGRGGFIKAPINSITTQLMDQLRPTTKQTLIDDGRAGVVSGQVSLITAQLMDNLRTTTKQTTIYDGRGGVITAPVNKIIAQLMDTVRATTKETMINNGRGGNIGGQVNRVTPQLMDELRTTTKETMISDGRGGMVKAPINAITAQLMDVLRATTKETTINDGRGGAITAPVNKIVSYLNDQVRTTLKQLLVDDNRGGNIGSLVNSTTPHYTSQLDPTLKQLMINDNRGGNVGSLINSITPHYIEQLDPTLKQLLIHTAYLSGLNKEGGTGYMVNQMSAPTTQRQTTLTPYTGIMNAESGNAYKILDYTAPTTLRQILSDLYYTTPAKDQESFYPRNNDAEYHMTIDNRKQQLIRGRTPTTRGADQIPGAAGMNVQLRNPINISRANAPYQPTYERLPTNYVQQQPLQQVGTRLAPYVLSGLTSNQLVNNLVFTQNRSDGILNDMSTSIASLK